MNTNDENKGDGVWPMPKFLFKVDIGTEFKDVEFQEVSGLDKENQVIEYRKSNSKVFSTVKLPGLVKHGNVALKRGVFINDNTFWKWHSEISMNTIKRTTIIIKLFDESGKVAIQWQLINAWPTKIIESDLKSDGNEVAIDSLEITYEQLIITNE